MSIEWIVLGLVAFALFGLCVYTLLKVSSECDRKARRAEKKLLPFSEVTVTRPGSDK